MSSFYVVSYTEVFSEFPIEAAAQIVCHSFGHNYYDCISFFHDFVSEDPDLRQEVESDLHILEVGGLMKGLVDLLQCKFDSRETCIVNPNHSAGEAYVIHWITKVKGT
jgi:hypothetical protein